MSRNQVPALRRFLRACSYTVVITLVVLWIARTEFAASWLDSSVRVLEAKELKPGARQAEFMPELMPQLMLVTEPVLPVSTEPFGARRGRISIRPENERLR